MKQNFKILTDDNFGKIPLILKSLLVGVVSGGAVVLYRILLTYAEKISFDMYGFLEKKLIFIPVAIIILCLMGYFVGFLISKDKMIVGSGIPQVEGILKGFFRKRRNWLYTVGGKVLGSGVAILGGLSIGREGPSIQIGASIAEGIGKVTSKKTTLEKKILMACGASAGLAAAFNAPMAGVVFVLEEVFKYFSPIILLSAMTSAVAADFVSKEVFGLEPIFHFEITSVIPLNSYWILLLMGIILGLMGALYNLSLLKLQKIFEKIKFLSVKTRVIVPFLMAGVLGITFPIVLGGGHELVGKLSLTSGIIFLLIVFAVKFAFSIVSFASGTPGGIFFPLLVLGATLGAIFAKISIDFFGLNQELFYNFVVLAMVGYFTAIVRAPITGIVLITEMTGSFSSMLPLTIVAVTAYIIADRVKSPPIYEALLEKMVEREHPEEAEEGIKKTFVEIYVQHESQYDHKKVKAINWPENSMLVGIKRGKRELMPKGDTLLKAGDLLIILADINGEGKVRDVLIGMNKHQ